MGVSGDYVSFVLDQLAGVKRLTSKRMFGGVGLYRDGVFFAIISADTLYFKVDAANRPDFEQRGMKAFRPYADKPQVSMSYYEVPADVLEDPEQCVAWALRAVAAAGATTIGAKRKPSATRR
jgi:DNA transformation protein